MKLFILLCGLGLYLAQETCAENEWRSKVLDKTHDFVLSWRIPTQASKPAEAAAIDMRIEARTHGWLGIGFSPTGGMLHADIITMWVDDATGVPYLQDRFARVDFVRPEVDKQQDVSVIRAWQNATHTIFEIRRKLDTCDGQEDRIITVRTE